MSGLWTIAVAVTASALIHLAVTDPKRRRVFRLAPWNRPRHVAAAWCLVLGSGLLLLAFGTAAGFVLWFGAVSVIGWGIAAADPARMNRLAHAVVSLKNTIRRRLGRPMRRRRARISRASAGQERRLDLLEQRVARLEAQTAAARRDA